MGEDMLTSYWSPCPGDAVRILANGYSGTIVDVIPGLSKNQYRIQITETDRAGIYYREEFEELVQSHHRIGRLD